VIPLQVAEVAALCPGRLEVEPWAEEITGVQIDSRRISEGDLFVAVGAGADFRRHALARGAAATLVPDDAHAALAALGRAVRERSRAHMVGITGSTGKTSTKDILAAICAPQRRTVAAEASYNAELGVPLTLCRLESDTELCILELAMRGLGQIAQLCEIALPEMGVVTNVGPAHLELVGSLDGVVRAKSELIESLPPGGSAVVPDGFPVTRTDLAVTRFGEPDAVVEDDRTVVRIDGREIEFSFTARHQARNALAALLAARAVGVEAESPVEVAFSRWRGDEHPLPGGGLLVNDCWNANPVSMRAALEHLADRARGRRAVAVLGGMAELGADGPRYHAEIAELAAQLGIEVLAVGELARGYCVAEWVADPETAAERARALIRPGDCVLVKGSRAVGLEAVADALTPVAA
jgi:UDP-N-acetylmuramoyl-tripeptide--D-alanyl-D-alanine ligase